MQRHKRNLLTYLSHTWSSIIAYDSQGLYFIGYNSCLAQIIMIGCIAAKYHYFTINEGSHVIVCGNITQIINPNSINLQKGNVPQ